MCDIKADEEMKEGKLHTVPNDAGENSLFLSDWKWTCVMKLKLVQVYNWLFVTETVEIRFSQ